MMLLFRRLLPPLVLLVLVATPRFVRGQRCTRREPADEDCSTITAGPCLIADSEANFTQIPTPTENTRSCYRTCIKSDPDSIFPDECQVNRVAFENQPLPEDFAFRRISSPNFDDAEFYRKSTVCKYHAACEPGQLLSYTITNHVLEPPVVCNGRNSCVDALTLITRRDVITSCNGPPPVTMDSDDSNLLVEFTANRKIETCGFNILVSCTEVASFFLPACSTPDSGIELPSLVAERGKRRMTDSKKANFLSARNRRSHRVRHIGIPSGAAVQYIDYTVRVFKGDIWWYKFRNTRYFRVYNQLEGYLTFSKSAPIERVFSGPGLLLIGRGIILYIQQDEVPAEFLPTMAEEEITVALQARLLQEFEPDDFNVDDDDDLPGPPPSPSECVPPNYTDEEESRFEVAALRYSNACNGVLRATACTYQEVIVKKTCWKDSHL